jgi:hypothetical protein
MLSGCRDSRGGINITPTRHGVTLYGHCLSSLFPPSGWCRRPQWMAGVRRQTCPSDVTWVNGLFDIFQRHWLTNRLSYFDYWSSERSNVELSLKWCLIVHKPHALCAPMSLFVPLRDLRGWLTFISSTGFFFRTCISEAYLSINPEGISASLHLQ